MLELLLNLKTSTEGVENDASSATKSNFGVVWPWPLTSWTYERWPFYLLAPLTTSANLQQSRCTRFQNVVFSRLVTNGRTERRTDGLLGRNIIRPAGPDSDWRRDTNVFLRCSCIRARRLKALSSIDSTSLELVINILHCVTSTEQVTHTCTHYRPSTFDNLDK